MFVTPSKRRQALGLAAFAVLCLGVGLGAGNARATGGDPAKGGKDDIQLFQGSWDLVKVSKDGQDIPDEFLKEIKMSFKGSDLIMSFMGQEKKAAIKIDATKKPKQIDLKFTDSDEAGYGIFEFTGVTGDSVKIYAAEKEADRPKEFKGEPPLVIVMKRAVPEKTDKGTGATDKGTDKKKRTSAVSLTAYEDDGQTDKDKLKGSWVIASGTKSGVELPADLVGKIKVSFDGDKFGVGTETDTKSGTYKLDEKTKPSQIDIKLDDEAQTTLGIYQVDGDTLKMCIIEKVAGRPADFKSETGSPNTLMVFKRDKDEKKRERLAPIDLISPRPDQGKTDAEKIQGDWTITATTIDGKNTKLLVGMLVTFKGDQFTLPNVRPMKFTLDEKAKIRQIDVIGEGYKELGIYEIDGDKLKLCLPGSGNARPTEFKADKTNQSMMVLTRAKGEKKREHLAPIAFFSPRAEQGKTDKDKLQGAWTITGGTSMGKDLPPDLVGKIKFNFKGDTFNATKAGETTSKSGTFKLDEKANPRHLDITTDGMTSTGIYAFDGDTLKVCLPTPGSARPADFKVDAGSLATVMIFKREDAVKKLQRSDGVSLTGLAAVVQGKSDSDKLQGTWAIASGMEKGKELPPELVGKVVFTFKGEQVTAGGTGAGKAGTFKLNEKAKPRQIDIVIEGKAVLGIYEVDGDTLKLCMGPNPDAPRPTEFKADAGSVNSNMLFKRQKTPAPRPALISTPRLTQDTKTGKGKSDKDIVQGAWAVESAIDDGMPMPDEIREMVRFVVNGDNIEIKIGELGLKGSYIVDEAKKPKTIDLKFEAGNSMIGIYELKDDSIKFCIVEVDKDTKRPAEFKSEAGSGHKLVVLKLAKDEKKDVKKDEKKDDIKKVSLAAARRAALLDGDAPQQTSKVDAEQALFQGVWQVVSATQSGMKMLPEEMVKLTVIVKGNTVSIGLDGQPAQTAIFTLDSSKKPKQMDVVPEDKKEPKGEGIYEFVGETLRICSNETGGPRPKEFVSDAANKNFLIELKRAQEQKKKAPAGVKVAPAKIAPLKGVAPLAPKQPAKGAKDQDLLQGTWQVVTMMPAPPKDITPDIMRLVIKGNEMTFTGDAKDNKPETVPFTLDPSKNPKQIDIVVPGKTEKSQGIYELTGDTLKIAFPIQQIKEALGPRPTQFKFEEGKVGVMELKRVTDKGKDKKTDAMNQPQDMTKKDEAKQPDKKPADPPKNDQERLLGIWKLLKAQGDGEEARADFVGPVRLIFETGSQLTVEGTAAGLGEKGKYKINDAVEPKQITLETAEKNEPIAGIYKFDGNKLFLCFGATPGERPDAFSADRGTKQVLFVLEQTMTAAALAQDKIDRIESVDRRKSQNNLQMLGIAMHTAADAKGGKFPAHAIYSKDGKTPLLSWRVALLAFLEFGEGNIYSQFKLDEPWDSEHNKKLISKMPKIFEPVGMAPKGEGLTHYQVFSGSGTTFNGPKDLAIGDIADGLSNTILIVEAKDPVIWTKPDDLVLPKPGEKMPELGGMFNTGMNVLWFDGSVQWVRRDIDPETLRAAVTPNGKEKFDRNKLNVPSKDSMEKKAPDEAKIGK